MSILSILESTRNHDIVIFLLCLATFRVYLEIIRFDFSALPLSQSVSKRFQYGRDHMRNFHRMGFYFSVGYIVLFAPEILLS